MAGKSVPSRRRTLGSLLGAGGLAVLVAASTAACGSASPAGASSSPAPVVTGGSSPTASTGPSSAAPAPAPATPATSAPPAAPSTAARPTGGGTPAPVSGPVVTPQTQLTAVPAGGRLVPFESATRSSSGTILYLGLLSQGGACGQYDVVLEQSSSSVGVGLVHLPAGSRICPMIVGRMLVEAKLSAPLGDRSVVDLANGQAVAAPVS